MTSGGATFSGICAALWLGGLWFCAPLLGVPNDPASRIRNAAALGVAIPFALAACDLLRMPACAMLLGALAAWRTVRIVRRFETRAVTEPKSSNVVSLVATALPSAAAVAVSWPALARPIVQGDSLGYHLPNAAAWSVVHGFWTTGTWYWWYPGGSELFAAGLYTVAGPLAVGLAGFVALLLLANRLYAFAVLAGVSPPAGASFAAAAITIGTFAFQGGSLENDVWLAAFLLEVVWAIREERKAIVASLAVLVLLKPYGFLFALIAAFAGRIRPVTAMLGFAAFAMWLARDAVLWRSALIHPSDMGVSNVFGTTIAAQGSTGLLTLSAAVARAGPGEVLGFAALFATLLVSRDSLVRSVALVTFTFFLFEPFGFANSIPQLATGASLRYADPALAIGFVGVLPVVRRAGTWIAIPFLLLCAYQIAIVSNVFATDANARAWYVAAAVIAVAIAADGVRTRGFATVFAALAVVAYTVRLAGSHAPGYYDDLLSRDPANRSLAFEWFERVRPPRIVGDHLRLGAVSVVSPSTLMQNTVGIDPCGEARRASALLAVADDPPTSAAEFAKRRTGALACGSVRYSDGAVLVIEPRRLVKR